MEKYFKKNLISIDETFFKNDIDMQIIEWWAQDEENDEQDDESNSESNSEMNSDVYTIRCFGVTKKGVSVTCKITGFDPYYYIKVPSSFSKMHLNAFLNHIESSYQLKMFDSPLSKENGKHRSCIVEKKDLFGFKNGKMYKFVKLVFTNYSALMKSRYLFKKATNIPKVTNKPTKFKLYESNVEPFMRYCHIKDILMAGWIKLPKGKYKKTYDTATTQVELSIDRKHVISMKENQDLGNFLQASWDIEVYSHDRTFPDPKFKIKDGSYPNEIFQIATTYKYTNDSGFLVKHLLTLKKCSKINDPNVIVEECSSEKELIKKWVDTVSEMDPDIFYTYNGDSFDCMYLVERAELYGFVKSKTSGNKTVKEGYLLKKLSRMTMRQADIKKEYFSSSAYGDSEFNRVYIPGRLNYDLLIHYKRGMKKYSSYKLDFIANEILKKGKNDVSPKQIFDYYEQGDPDKIKEIGEYCIIDTSLLQDLVDKQMILTNIMQLANVTFVPIGFLTTRGQTIKVFSQVLRKARQMDFLVPHTNFNEDNHHIQIKFKDPHPFNIDDVSEYLEINCGRSQVGNSIRPFVINARIHEIIDENNILVLSDTEIGEKEYYNISAKYKYKDYSISRMFSNAEAVDDSFTGATVLDAIPGMYTENVAVLDFASLYPTVEISRNLCYSTLVMDSKYLNCKDTKYETIEWDDKIEYKLKQTCCGIGKSGKSKGEVCGKQAFFEVEKSFYCRIHDPLKKERTSDEKCQKKDISYSYTIVQPSVDSDGNIKNKGVIPALLEELYAERKKVKKLMAKAAADKNKLLESILDSTQLAIKVSLNSCYGFLSRNQGNLICKPLGQLTTAIGRMLIQQSKNYAENEFMTYLRENELLKHQVKEIKHDMSKDEESRFLKKHKIL